MTSEWNDTEDGHAGSQPRISEHESGTVQEFVKWSCHVRVPFNWQPRARLVIRAYTPYADADARVTLALEVTKG